jgi:hypothetical protein
MSEKRIESIVRGFGEAFVKRDIGKMRSGFHRRQVQMQGRIKALSFPGRV